MAATDIIFNGLAHMVNATVEVVVGGLDCGAFVVAAGGFVTVPLASIPTPAGFSSAGNYFQTLDVGPYDTTTYGDATTAVTMQVNGGGRATMYLPVYIGFLYPSIGQTMRPATQAQTKSQTGGATGKLRRVWSVAALLSKSQGVSFGTTAANLQPASFQFANNSYFQNINLFDGVLYMDIDTGDDFDGMTMWYCGGPYPCVLNSLTGFAEFKERT